MLICIDAGHGRYTPGKRCMESIDPGETREWILNSRIANEVQRLLSGYRCSTMRVDDVTGQRDVPLKQRTAAANRAKADLYLSIHHNAGMDGGSGGGIVVFVHPSAGTPSKKVQRSIYNHTVSRTGLKGNRSTPLAQANFQVLRDTKMPAVLGEFGFMDSIKDTPIILTADFAQKVAAGIVAGVVEIYKLEEVDTMTEERVRQIAREEFAKLEAQRAAQPAEDWAKPYIQQAVAAGLMAENAAGSIDRPQAPMTRQEMATTSVAILKAVQSNT